jgi:SET domain-containing protein
MLEVFDTKGKGSGVRALENIKKGQFICEYIGEVIDAALWLAKKKTKRDIYGMELIEGFYVDPEKMGNTARFFNHSCLPNAIAEQWIIKGEPHIVIRAAKAIKTNKEITFDYGSEYYIGFCKCEKCDKDMYEK